MKPCLKYKIHYKIHENVYSKIRKDHGFLWYWGERDTWGGLNWDTSRVKVMSKIEV